ncbi:hypothetical protein [Solemya velesiana gill symbiont]|uniref:Uncharacterized protein n=1 Tax=Solemya velesiana gill symbiont TaxID=1918948 RepID=A0A1T2KUB9_9GAMM|nr:hypothetical protein [Solemya velesiana gill symbiont]OOZ36424.1 hypothetical protein BOW51_07280 [Solemya velesiana gill symbiont]
MNEANARYEFRAFAHDFGIVEDAIRRLASVVGYMESREIYIVSAATDEYNTKVRNALLDIKELIKCERGLEQWSPRIKRAFPLARETIEEEIHPLLGVTVTGLERHVYSLEQYLDEIVTPHPELSIVNVYKQRSEFDIDGCTTELANVYINGARIKSACLESIDPDLVLGVRERTRLNQYENVNYLLEIKRVIGMEPLPDGVYYNAT